jgi:uncharacterized protein (TIGR00661 family)
MNNSKLRFLFLVQGEGRGHMTQSIALQDLLANAGHEVVGVMVGKSPRREIPKFYYDKINSPLSTFESPNFILDKNGKSINVPSSIIHNLKKNKVFIKNLGEISRKIKEYKPDIIINFYELMCGLYFLTHKPRIKHVTLAHQFLLPHPEFETPKGNRRDKNFMALNNKLTSFRANKLLALSFREMHDLPLKKTYVVPPLLRKEVKQLEVTQGDFILSYVLNDGYSKEILDWHKDHKDTKVECFWDRKDIEDVYQPHENITFNKLNDVKFLDYMGRCKGYVSTAGFESICEAMYLGKPAMLVPTGGHFEQECNAIDAIKAGAGVAAKSFNFKTLIDYLPNHQDKNKEFRNWADKADEIFLRHLENC